MQLLQSWKESLSLFIPKNFKLFILVTLKSALETYSLLFYYFWWLILITLAFDIGCYWPECVLVGTPWELVKKALELMLGFALFMLVRPSVSLKRWGYFIEHSKKMFFGFAGFVAAFPFLRRYLYRFVGYLPSTGLLGYVSAFLNTMLTNSWLYVAPTFVFATLFYFDSDGSIESFFLSFYRGVKMLVFNLPFVLVSLVGMWVFMGGIQWIARTFWTDPLVGRYLFFSFMPFMVSYFKSMYIKRLHDRFELYFS